jgi:hypothetical protein
VKKLVSNDVNVPVLLANGKHKINPPNMLSKMNPFNRSPTGEKNFRGTLL